MKLLAIDVVVGVRPNFMKIAPIARALTAKKMGVKVAHVEAGGSPRVLYK